MHAFTYFYVWGRAVSVKNDSLLQSSKHQILSENTQLLMMVTYSIQIRCLKFRKRFQFQARGDTIYRPKYRNS